MRKTAECARDETPKRTARNAGCTQLCSIAIRNLCISALCAFSVSTNVDASIKVVASRFRRSDITADVGLNSFQTSGQQPGRRCSAVMSAFSASAPSARPLPSRLTGPDPIPHLTLTHLCDRRARDKQARQTDPLASSPGPTASTTSSPATSTSSIETISGVGAGGRLHPRRAARRQVGRHGEQAGDRAPRAGAADAGRAAGTAAAVRRPRSAVRCRSCAPSATAWPATTCCASRRS